MADVKLNVILSAEDRAKKKLEQFKKLLGKAGIAAAIAATGIAMYKLGKASLKAAADFEQTEIAFTTLLGSAEEAGKFLRELADFAAKTPFTIQGVEKSARQLLAVGFNAEEILPALKSLGDVASGLGLGEEGLQRLILNLGQVKTQAKLTGRELRDFAVAGVPILDELAKNLGKTVVEIRDMISAGEIGSKDVIKAFNTMSSEGGKFANLMDKQSKSLNGMISNLADQWNLFLRKQGKHLLGWAKEFVDFGIKMLPKLSGAFDNVFASIESVGESLSIMGDMFSSAFPRATQFAREAISGLISSLKGLMWVLDKTIFGVFNLINAIGALKRAQDQQVEATDNLYKQQQLLRERDRALIESGDADLIKLAQLQGRIRTQVANGISQEQIQITRNQITAQKELIENAGKDLSQIKIDLGITKMPTFGEEDLDLGGGGGGGGVAKEMKSALEEATEVAEKAWEKLAKGQEKYHEIIQRTRTSLKELEADHKETSTELEKDWRNAQKALLDYHAEFDKQMSGMEQDYKQKIAGEFVNLEQQKAKIIEELSSEETLEKRKELQKQLEDINANLEKNKSLFEDAQEEIDEMKRRASITEAERIAEDYENARTVAQLEFEARKKEFIDKINQARKAIEDEKDLYKKKFEAIERMRTYDLLRFRAYMAQRRSIAGEYLGETEFAQGQGAGGTTINITGTFLSDDAAEKVGDMIVQKLKAHNSL